MTLIIALTLTLSLLYFVGVIVGSNIERQRWKEGKTNSKAPDNTRSVDIFA